MFNLLKQFSQRAEELRGRQLAYTLGAVFVVFLILGFSINYFIVVGLNNNEIEPVDDQTGIVSTTTITNFTEEGVITYVDPMNYPEDDISYYLADSSGKEIILLKATDQKLQVSEGLYVKVQGQKTKTIDGEKEVLIVDSIIINKD